MKTIEELEVFLSERVSEKAEKIKECQGNIQKSNQEMEKANAYLLDAESKETPNAYQTAKDALWSASNAKEFYTKQLEKLKSSSLLTCIPETPNYDLKKKAETIDINRF